MKKVSLLGLIFWTLQYVAIAQSSTFTWMPIPKEFTVGAGKHRITTTLGISINSEASTRVFNSSNRFLRRLDNKTGQFFKQGVISKEFPQKVASPTLIITSNATAKVELYEDESYVLDIKTNKISLTAPNDLGILHGLETLLQLVSVDENGFYFPELTVKDSPRFPWRGLMIDASRHFMPVDVIKRNLDAMAAVKMNVLHFHLCDNHGWRVESKKFPKLHQLASDGQYYTQEEIKGILAYANERGIRVMPEFDVPGHATAFLVAFPELASAPGPYEIERNAGIFDPVLNPTQENTYAFLDQLFEEMAGLFPDPYFHIGGDENNGNHWKENKDIQEFMKKNNIKTTLELQTYFNNRIIKTVKRLNKKMMGWEEILQPGLSKDAIIHSWFGKESLYKAASQGYATLLSNGFYIDLLLPASEHYINDPLPPFATWSKEEQKYPLTPEQEKLILGGEATMWSELVTPLTIDSRIWPRTAAIAERLWSPASVKDVNDMYRRLPYVNAFIEDAGGTQLRNKEYILRNISNGADLQVVRNLIDAIEPYKVYTRNRGGLMYKMYSPLTLVADAANVDAPAALAFNQTVQRYLISPNESDKKSLQQWLTLWKNNHEPFAQAVKIAPLLAQVEKLSLKLSQASQIGLEALNATTLSDEIYNQHSKKIAEMVQETEKKRMDDKTFEDGRCSIAVLDGIQKILDSTNPKATLVRLAKLEEEKKKLAAQQAPH